MSAKNEQLRNELSSGMGQLNHELSSKNEQLHNELSAQIAQNAQAVAVTASRVDDLVHVFYWGIAFITFLITLLPFVPTIAEKIKNLFKNQSLTAEEVKQIVEQILDARLSAK